MGDHSFLILVKPQKGQEFFIERIRFLILAGVWGLPGDFFLAEKFQKDWLSFLHHNNTVSGFTMDMASFAFLENEDRADRKT